MASYWGEIDVIQNSQSISGNYTNVTINYFVCSDTGTTFSGYETYPYLGVYYGGKSHEETQALGSFNFATNKRITIGSITMNIPHNADGTMTISASFTWNSNHSLIGTVRGNVENVALTTIPRFATSVQSLSSKTVNSIKMKWSSDSTIDYIWYSKDGGSSWTAVGSVSSTSGYYTISGLEVNSTYKIKTRVRRKDSQLTTDSSSASIATYDIAKITEAPNANIGSSHTIKWTNPSGATTTLKLCETDGTQVYNVGTVTGTSKTVTPTASTIYALTPKSNSIKLRYIITTTANGISYTHYKDCTFYVTNSNPTFGNCEYRDVGGTSTQLTGDNQTVINGYNILEVVISTANKAVAKNSATMSKYRLVCGNQSTEVAYSDNSEVVLSLGYITDMTFTVYAIDSRGNSTPVTKSVATWKDYFKPVIAVGSAERTELVNKETKLTFSGKIWNESFGAEQNEIVTCKYEYKKTTDTEYLEGETELTPEISGNTFAVSTLIKGDADAEGFEISQSYNIRITIQDKVEAYTATYNLILNAGKPALAIHRDGVAFGAPYNEDVGGLLQIDNVQAETKETTSVAVYGKGEEKGLIDPNTALENLILTQHTNGPDKGTHFYHIRTIFYQRKSVDSNRIQIGYGYRVNKIYYRYYYSGSWSDWTPVLNNTEWQTPTTLLNNWQNYGESFATAQYRKIGNEVTLKGLVKSGTIPSAVFLLPEGCRPAETLIMSGMANSSTLTEIRIEKSGYVTINKGSATWTSLDGISFLVD